MTTRVDSHEWGTMTWLADADIGATTTISVARMVLNQGKTSPLHHHPNCEEVVMLESGTVLHEVGGLPIDQEPGTCIVIPAGVGHFTRNVGAAPAHLLVSYGAAVREYVEGAKE